MWPEGKTMPLLILEKCWRGRDDCTAFAAIEAPPPDTSDEQMATLDFAPISFVCCGCVREDARIVPQDAYRLCFKNAEVDDMSDNDEQDLAHLLAVISQALAAIAARRVNGGMIEVPTEQGRT
jgi:hypothetical protein